MRWVAMILGGILTYAGIIWLWIYCTQEWSYTRRYVDENGVPRTMTMTSHLGEQIVISAVYGIILMAATIAAYGVVDSLVRLAIKKMQEDNS